MSDEKKAEIIKLEDLIPSSSSFTLKMFEDFEFKLKPCTGGMLIEMTRAIGNIESLLANPNAENISKIAMSLFEYDSAVKFKKQTVKTIDVNTGDESEAKIGGYVLLMHAISGTAEQYSIYGAILKSFGYDQTRIDDLIKKIKDSMNDAVNNKINEPLKKKSKKENITWPEIFDLLSNEYGWNTEYILSRTLFEINWRLLTIIKRTNTNRNFEMAVHGVTPNGETNAKRADTKLSDEQKKAMEIALLQAKKKKNGTI